MGTEGRLASLDTNMKNLTLRLTEHTAQDDDNFSKIIDVVESLDEKMDQLLLREAEAKGARRATVAIAAIVSSVISAAAWAFPLLVG